MGSDARCGFRTTQLGDLGRRCRSSFDTSRICCWRVRQQDFFANRKKLASVRSRLQRSRPRPSHSRSSGRRVRRQVDARSRMKAVAYQRPTDPARSELMRRVRQRDTKPEQDVAAALRELGLRFRRNVRALPGSPDFANRARHWAVFVHGCFWHRHKNCPRTTTPTRNRRFWLDKFDANRKRDQRNARKLRAIGFA